jgi:hypothetical protein
MIGYEEFDNLIEAKFRIHERSIRGGIRAGISKNNLIGIRIA